MISNAATCFSSAFSCVLPRRIEPISRIREATCASPTGGESASKTSMASSNFAVTEASTRLFLSVLPAMPQTYGTTGRR